MKKNYIKIIILLIISLAAIIFTYNDHFIYQKSILRVDKIDNKITNDQPMEEKTYEQVISGTIVNGKFKGNTLEYTNTYSESLVMEDKIEKHTEVFVEVSEDGKEILGVYGIKRDKYIVILLVIFIDLIILIANKKGLKTLLSLFVNLGIFAGALLLFMKYYANMNMLLLYIVVSIIYVVTYLLPMVKLEKH